MTTTSDDSSKTGFSADERAAMKQRSRELREEAKREKAADKAAANTRDVLDAIAAMPEHDRALAERVHDIVAQHAPALAPKTWYGMPAYADADGKAVVFFQAGAKFGSRYATLGFQDGAAPDDGSIWPTSFALADIDDDAEAAIADLVRRAAPRPDGRVSG